jgi:trigger factor
MQVSVENTGPLERKIRVEVPEEKIASEVQNRLQSISRTTRIQGFRPGKAPLKVVEKRFGSKIRQEVIGEVVQSSFYEVLAKEKLRPASQPTIDPMDDNLGAGLVYTATFEIYPEITLSSVEDLEITIPLCEITNADVDKMIEVIRKQQQTYMPVKRKAKKGDFLTIDFKGTIQGKEFDGGEGKDYRIELGSKRLIAGFEEGLTNSRAGDEIILELNFPKDYHKPEFSGKPVKFIVSVKEVCKAVLPEINNELFASMGVKEGGLQVFMDEVRRNMEREVEQTIASRSKNVVLDALYTANKIELPKSLIKNEAKRLQEQYQASMKMRGIAVKQHSNEVTETEVFQTQAEKNVAMQLIVAEIIKSQQLKVEQSQIRHMIENVAQSYEDPNEVINWYYSDRNRLVEVEAIALEDEVIKWIKSRAKVTEKHFSFDDLMNKGQTETI